MIEETRQRGAKHRWWLWLLILVVAVGGAYLLFPRASQGQSTGGGKAGGNPGGASSTNGNGKNSGKGGGRAGAARAVPVSAASAKVGDLNIYVIGLGNVTAYNTVTVRTRVDGELMKVYFREGQMVKEGQPIVEIDPRPYQVQLTQAEGAMARDQATLENARVDLQRYQVLIQRSAVTQQQLDTQAATVRQQEGTVKSDQGAIDNARLNLVYCHITAPISGRIGLRGVDRGNIVHAADAGGLATITQIQPIAVIFNMPEDNLPEVQKAMRSKGRLAAEAYDRDLKIKLGTGRLLTLDNQIDQSTGTVRVKLEFANRETTLFPNQFVNAKLLIDVHKGVVMVPNAAIQRSPQSTFVYLIKPDKTVEMRNVTLGATEADQIEIDRGLKAGDQVVTEGADKLQSGSKVVVHGGQGAGGKNSSDQGVEPKGSNT